jgi:hypothetical protein
MRHLHGVTGRTTLGGVTPAQFPSSPCMMMPIRFSLI